MESSHLGAASFINGSWIVLNSSVKSWVGFRNKRRRFRVRQMCKEQRTKREVVRLVKRSESLRRILKQYGVLEDNCEETNGSSSFSPSALDNSPMIAVEKLPDANPKENHHETMSISFNHSGQKLLSFPHLETDTVIAIVLPTIAFCITCILWAFRGRFSKNSENSGAKTHQRSRRTRWRSVLGDSNEPHGADELDSLQDNMVQLLTEHPFLLVGPGFLSFITGCSVQVILEEEEAPEEVCGGYSRVESEYKKFLSECGITEHGNWRWPE